MRTSVRCPGRREFFMKGFIAQFEWRPATESHFSGLTRQGGGCHAVHSPQGGGVMFSKLFFPNQVMGVSHPQCLCTASCCWSVLPFAHAGWRWLVFSGVWRPGGGGVPGITPPMRWHLRVLLKLGLTLQTQSRSGEKNVLRHFEWTFLNSWNDTHSADLQVHTTCSHCWPFRWQQLRMMINITWP